ncbi:hypothetical protein V5O48_006461 [Marasmius crinis-equi]|uniref:Uncharacterized protein n=1 Tax=Marasmius crinis-equi TaxID=585013 RepID=A0ABR3FJZ5_9AGAR
MVGYTSAICLIVAHFGPAVSDSPPERAPDSLRSSSISLQNISTSTPIGKAEATVIATVAFFIIIAAIAIIRVYVFSPTSNSPAQFAASGDTKATRHSTQSLVSEKISTDASSPEVEVTERLSHHDPETVPEARSDAPHSGSQLSSRVEEDVSAIISVRAGTTSMWRRSQRSRAGSQSSAVTNSTNTSSSSITATTATLDSLCSTSPPRSSMTSVISGLDNSDSEIEFDVVEEETVVYEVKRAQTQSMEVKRGVLVSWRASAAVVQKDPALPTVIVSELDEPAEAPAKETKFTPNGFLHPQSTPSLPSLASSESSTSTVSVDLDEFPLPPKLLASPSPSLAHSLLTVPDGGILLETGRRDGEKRSTVDRVIMLYV